MPFSHGRSGLPLRKEQRRLEDRTLRLYRSVRGTAQSLWAICRTRKSQQARYPEQSRGLMSGRTIVVEVLSEPSFDFRNAHSFALLIVCDLIVVDFPKAEIS